MTSSAKKRGRDVLGVEVRRVEVDGEALTLVSLPIDDPPLLTAAERAVAYLLLAGRTNVAIARERRTSLRTVANQIAAIYRKLEVRSRSELAAVAERVGRS